jgi:hypothetical protein
LPPVKPKTRHAKRSNALPSKDSLDVTGSGMFSRYTPAMKRMNEAFMQQEGYDPGTLYIFVLNYASSPSVSGDMPRGAQFGYIFTGAVADAAGAAKSADIIGRTVAHELGHGMFRLKHTFDSEYGIAEATTDNLMDYAWGTALVKHQWDAIHAPGLMIGLFETDEDGMMAIDSQNDKFVFDFLRLLRMHKNYNISLTYAKSYTNKYSGAEALFFTKKMTGWVWLRFENVQNLSNITFLKDEINKTYSRFFINCGKLGQIICEYENDRNIIFDFINGDNDVFDHTQQNIGSKTYSYSSMYNEMELIKSNLLREGIYKDLNDHERLILDLPLLMWSMNFKYAGIFLYNWIVGDGDIQMDNDLFAFMDQWGLLRNRKQDYNNFMEQNKNIKIEQIISNGNILRLYPLKDVRKYIADKKYKNDLLLIDSLINFSRMNIIQKELTDNINDPHVASFGTFSIAFNFEGRYVAENNQIIIEKVYEIINDGFDFIDDSFISQRLGAWQSSIFAPYRPIEKFNIIDVDMLN